MYSLFLLSSSFLSGSQIKLYKHGEQMSGINILSNSMRLLRKVWKEKQLIMNVVSEIRFTHLGRNLFQDIMIFHKILGIDKTTKRLLKSSRIQISTQK